MTATFFGAQNAKFLPCSRYLAVCFRPLCLESVLPYDELRYIIRSPLSLNTYITCCKYYVCIYIYIYLFVACMYCHREAVAKASALAVDIESLLVDGGQGEFMKTSETPGA